MGRIFGFAVKSAILAATFFLAASLAGVACAADNPPKLSGHWQFNKDQSDDAQQRISEAQQIGPPSDKGGDVQSLPRGGPGVGYPDGVGWPGGGMGFPGPGVGVGLPGRRAHDKSSNVSSDEWDRLAENPKELQIAQRPEQVVITDDSGRAQTFYLDGKKHEEKDANGKKVSTKTEWQGNELVAETKSSHSTKLTQRFRLSDDGKQLYVTTRFENPSLRAPVSIRRVYDLLGATTQQGAAPK